MTKHGGNRRALLDAAIRCIEQSGYARTTARDLVAASGTNLGAIGYHFGSKEALLNEALAECCRRWIRRLTETAIDTSEPDGVRTAIDVAYRTVAANRALAVAYVEAWAQAQHSPELRTQLAGHYAEFRELTTASIHKLLPSTPPLTSPTPHTTEAAPSAADPAPGTTQNIPRAAEASPHSDGTIPSTAGTTPGIAESTPATSETIAGPAGTSPDVDPEALSAVIVALTDGLMVQWLLDPSAAPDPSRLANAVRALTLIK